MNERLQRISRYGMVGVAVLGFNMGLAALAFRVPSLNDTALARNVTNVVVTEIALMFAFVLHRRITWGAGESGFWRSCLSFHVVSSVGLALRFGMFYLLDGLGFAPMLTTLASMLVAIVFNFLGYDRMVFRGSSPT
ncbi:MAG: GtrA family protein [Myxococcales bacterium]